MTDERLTRLSELDYVILMNILHKSAVKQRPYSEALADALEALAEIVEKAGSKP